MERMEAVNVLAEEPANMLCNYPITRTGLPLPSSAPRNPRAMLDHPKKILHSKYVPSPQTSQIRFNKRLLQQERTNTPQHEPSLKRSNTHLAHPSPVSATQYTLPSFGPSSNRNEASPPQKHVPTQSLAQHCERLPHDTSLLCKGSRRTKRQTDRCLTHLSMYEYLTSRRYPARTMYGEKSRLHRGTPIP